MMKRIAAACALCIAGISTEPGAVQVTLTDSCGTSVVAISAGTTTGASNGDLTINNLSGPYTALFGGCVSPAPTRPVCTLSASQLLVAPGGATSLFATCTSSPTSYVW